MSFSPLGRGGMNFFFLGGGSKEGRGIIFNIKRGNMKSGALEPEGVGEVGGY